MTATTETTPAELEAAAAKLRGIAHEATQEALELAIRAELVALLPQKEREAAEADGLANGAEAEEKAEGAILSALEERLNEARLRAENIAAVSAEDRSPREVARLWREPGVDDLAESIAAESMVIAAAREVERMERMLSSFRDRDYLPVAAAARDARAHAARLAGEVEQIRAALEDPMNAARSRTTVAWFTHLVGGGWYELILLAIASPPVPGSQAWLDYKLAVATFANLVEASGKADQLRSQGSDEAFQRFPVYLAEHLRAIVPQTSPDRGPFSPAELSRVPDPGAPRIGGMQTAMQDPVSYSSPLPLMRDDPPAATWGG